MNDLALVVQERKRFEELTRYVAHIMSGDPPINDVCLHVVEGVAELPSDEADMLVEFVMPQGKLVKKP